MGCGSSIGHLAEWPRARCPGSRRAQSQVAAFMKRELKPLPKFKTEAAERKFWETHDSTGYVDWSQAQRVRFPHLKPSTQAISLRLPLSLLEQIKIEANRRDVPYQSLIKVWLAEKAEQVQAAGLTSCSRGRPGKRRAA